MIKTNTERKTFVIDIDHTICIAPKVGDAYDYSNAKPIKKVIYTINANHTLGHKIILFTARGMRTFKGPKKFEDLQKMLSDIKYTFIIPIEKGWTTAKYCEMLHYGIIPFMHPYYDSQRNLGDLKFLRVNNSEELYERIEYLENNPEKRIELLNKLRKKLLKPEYYNGKHLNNLIMNNLYKLSNKKYNSLDDVYIENINKTIDLKIKKKKLF